MENYSVGEIVLLSFPFADATGAKRRPALILLDAADEDIVVARVTSQATRTPLDVELMGWQQAGLLIPSVIRVHKVATLEKGLVMRRLGTLQASDLDQVRKILKRLCIAI